MTTFWAIVSTGLIASALVTAARIRHRRSSHRFPVSLDVRYALTPQALPVVPARAQDLNTFGIALSTSEPLERNTSVTVHLRLDGEFLVVRGTVVRGSTESGTYGIAFDPLPAKTRDAIAHWCFRHPFGPALDLDRSDRGEVEPAVRDARATAA